MHFYPFMQARFKKDKKNSKKPQETSIKHTKQPKNNKKAPNHKKPKIESES